LARCLKGCLVARRPNHSLYRSKKKPLRPSHQGFHHIQLGWFSLEQTFTLCALASKFPRPANSLRLLTCLLLRGLLKISPGFHFTEQAFALHFFLQRTKGLLNIVVTHSNLNNGQLSIDVLFDGQFRLNVVFWPMGPRSKSAYNMWKAACLLLDPQRC